MRSGEFEVEALHGLDGASLGINGKLVLKIKQSRFSLVTNKVARHRAFCYCNSVKLGSFMIFFEKLVHCKICSVLSLLSSKIFLPWLGIKLSAMIR